MKPDGATCSLQLLGDDALLCLGLLCSPAELDAAKEQGLWMDRKVAQGLYLC